MNILWADLWSLCLPKRNADRISFVIVADAWFFLATCMVSNHFWSWVHLWDSLSLSGIWNKLRSWGGTDKRSLAYDFATRTRSL